MIKVNALEIGRIPWCPGGDILPQGFFQVGKLFQLQSEEDVTREVGLQVEGGGSSQRGGFSQLEEARKQFLP
jgi:hypothetical protein